MEVLRNNLNSSDTSIFNSVGIPIVIGSKYDDTKYNLVDEIIDDKTSLETVKKTYEEIKSAALQFANYCETEVDKYYKAASRKLHPDMNMNKGVDSTEEFKNMQMLQTIFKNFSLEATTLIRDGLLLEVKNSANIIQLSNFMYNTVSGAVQN